MDYKVALAFVLPLTVGIAALGSAIALGRTVSSAMEATARQPEAATKILIAMATGCAFIEALTIYALVYAFTLAGRPEFRYKPEQEKGLKGIGVFFKKAANILLGKEELPEAVKEVVQVTAEVNVLVVGVEGIAFGDRQAEYRGPGNDAALRVGVGINDVLGAYQALPNGTRPDSEVEVVVQGVE